MLTTRKEAPAGPRIPDEPLPEISPNILIWLIPALPIMELLRMQNGIDGWQVYPQAFVAAALFGVPRWMSVAVAVAWYYAGNPSWMSILLLLIPALAPRD